MLCNFLATFSETITKDPLYTHFDTLSLSSQSKDFVKSMLTKDPKQRIRLEELLKHQWLTVDCESLRARREKATRQSSFRVNTLSRSISEENVDEHVD